MWSLEFSREATRAPLRMHRQEAIRIAHRGMSVAQVAEAVAITPAHVSKLESGKGDPSVAVLVKLANVLHNSIEELVGFESE